ncbi:MAG: hypothetical protein KF809_01715 [Chloroflexi bacterium]|nr:hypothetical protein [Chloroflexota bacterium]
MAVRPGIRRALIPATASLLVAALVVPLMLPGTAAGQDASPAGSAVPGASVVPTASVVPGPSTGPAASPQPQPVIALPVMPHDDELTLIEGLVLAPPVLPADPDLLAAAAAAAADQVDSLAIAHWRVPVLAESLQGDLDATFAFVRDHIRLDVYPGILRGPEGALAARSGNAWDRALLLRTLLDRMRFTTRLVTGELDDAMAAQVLERVFQGPAVPLQDGRAAAIGSLDVTALGDRARRDDARVRLALGDRLDSMTAEQLADLAPEVRSHVWVQVRWGTGWRDLDPTLVDSDPGETLTAPTGILDAAPDDLRHTLRTQLIASSLVGSSVTDQVVLDDTVEALTAARQQRFLYFQPSVEGLGGTITEVLSGTRSWTPILLVDGETTKGSAFEVGGRGTDLFGDEVDAPPLVRLRVVVTRHVPGRPDVSATHWLVDRIPPALADAETLEAEQLAPLPEDTAGPLAMGVIQQLLVSTGGADPYVAAVRRGVAADFLYRLLSDPATATQHPLGDLLYPVAAGTQVLVTGSEQVAIPALDEPGRVRAWVDAPRVTLVDLGQDPAVEGMFSLSTDLLIDDLRVVARDRSSVPDAVQRTIWYGALQSALESVVAQRQLAGLSDTPIVPVGASFTDLPLSLLDASHRSAVGSTVLRSTLDAGRLALVPGDAASALAWWEVDPRTGMTRAVLDPGLGGVNGKIAWGSIKHLPPPPRITGPNGPNTWHVHPDGSIRRYPPGARPPGGGAPQGPPPSRCGGGQEYVTIVGCVSVPAAWAIRIGVGLVVTELLGYAVMYLVT